MRVLSLFSGIGAFEVALDRENIDWELDHYCEIDKFACQSYNMIHNTTDNDNLEDVKNIDFSKIGKIDLLTYGFPCQDISLSGKLKGFVDKDGQQTRSGLFFNAANVIKTTKPKFAIFENVKNLTSKRFKNEFEIVLNTLDELGYNTYWKVLNAKDYGIPQNRERIFGISIRKDIDHGFEFPFGFELDKHLIDILENEVDESYYISPEKLNPLIIDKPQTILCDKVCRIGKVNNSQDGIIVNPYGISPTHTAGHGNTPKILEPCFTIRENNKKGFKDVYKGDTVNLEHPNSKTRRGRIGEQVAQTLTTVCTQAVVVDEPLICALRGRYDKNGKIFQNLEINNSKCSNTLTTVQKDNYVFVPIEKNNEPKDYKIRKLTPRECWRLMGFGDDCFDKVKNVSNTQLYKQAGNSIVVDVLRYIFRELIKQYPDFFKVKDRSK